MNIKCQSFDIIQVGMLCYFQRLSIRNRFFAHLIFSLCTYHNMHCLAGFDTGIQNMYKPAVSLRRTNFYQPRVSLIRILFKRTWIKHQMMCDFKCALMPSWILNFTSIFLLFCQNIAIGTDQIRPCQPNCVMVIGGDNEVNLDIHSTNRKQIVSRKSLNL